MKFQQADAVIRIIEQRKTAAMDWSTSSNTWQLWEIRKIN